MKLRIYWTKYPDDRIRHELELILEEPKAPEMLSRMDELNLLSQLFIYIKWDSDKFKTLHKYYQDELPQNWFKNDHQKYFQTKTNGAYLLLMAEANQLDVLKILRQLRLRNHLARMIIQTNSLWHQLSTLKNLKPSQATKLLEEYSQLEIYCVYFLCTDKKTREILENFALKWRSIRPVTDGQALLQRGLKPGPVFTNILAELKAAWLDGKINSEKEEYDYLDLLLEKVHIS